MDWFPQEVIFKPSTGNKQIGFQFAARCNMVFYLIFLKIYIPKIWFNPATQNIINLPYFLQDDKQISEIYFI